MFACFWFLFLRSNILLIHDSFFFSYLFFNSNEISVLFMLHVPKHFPDTNLTTMIFMITWGQLQTFIYEGKEINPNKIHLVSFVDFCKSCLTGLIAQRRGRRSWGKNVSPSDFYFFYYYFYFFPPTLWWQLRSLRLMGKTGSIFSFWFFQGFLP